jgi:hypothetical protein
MIIVQDNGKVNVEVEEYTETLLWENSSPTSQFTSDSLTLSDNIKNYDYLKVYWRFSTTDNTTNFIIVNVNEFLQTEVIPTDRPAISCSTSETTYGRIVRYNSDTTVYISQCAKWWYNTTVNTYCIPIKVTGIKKERREAGNRKVKTGFLPSLPSDGFINCGFDPKHVMFVGAYGTSYTMCCVYDENISSTKYRRYYANTSAEQNKEYTVGDTEHSGFQSIGNGTNGFTINYVSSFTNVRYIATD